MLDLKEPRIESNNGYSPLAIRARGLKKRYGKVHALAGMDLDVPTGCIYGLLGPNGAGKTTFLGALLGLIKTDAGDIELFGQDSTRNRPRLLRRVGAVIETPLFYPYLSGRKNLQVMARYWGQIDPARIDEALVTVGLGDRADSKFKTYSTGMRQRLGLANALIADPELLVLDEPTAGLDPRGAREFRDLIRQVAEGAEATVILSSHLLSEVEQTCDQVGILVAGSTVVQGSVKDLLASGRGVRFTVSDVSGSLEALPVGGWRGTRESETTLIAHVESEQAADVNRALVSAGIDVLGIGPAAIDLETFYIDNTADESP